MSDVYQGNQVIGQADSMAEAKALRGRHKLRPVQKAKEVLLDKVNKIGTQGLSDAEQEQMTTRAMDATGAQVQGQSSGLSRQAMSGQAFQAGELQKAQGGLADASADAGAKSSAAAQKLSEQVRMQRDAEATAALERQQERAKDNARYWSSFGIDTLKAVPEIAASLMGL